MSNTGQLPELESLRSQVADLVRELTARDQAQLAQQKDIDGELQNLRKQSDLLQAIMTGTAADTGDTFFASLATHLTATLNMQYAVIGEVLEKTPARIRTLAVSSGGTLLENFEYDLAAAPCGTGLTESFWCFEQGVQALFPSFPPLAAMGVESHSGVAIRNHQGKVVGLIVVMDTKPIASQDRLQTLLKVFAPRAAAELHRKHAEDEHRQALHELQNIMETVPDFMFTLDTQGNLVKWNRRVEEVAGYSREELHGKSALAFVPAQEQEQTALAIQRAVTDGYAELKGYLLTKDQRTIPYHWTGAALKDPQGRIIGITGIGRDVSEQRQAAEALQRQRHHLLEAQALAHLGSWEWDIESGETDWSEEQYRIFGYEPGTIAVTYDTFLAALLPDDHDRVLAAVNDALLGKCPLDLECRIVRPNGDIRVIHMRADVQRDATAHPIAMAGTALDITERKQTEEALRVSEERWHLAVQGSNDGIWDWNIQAGNIFFSARWKAMRGFGDQEVRNHIDEWRSRIHPDDLDRVLQSIDHYLAKQTAAFCEEYRVQRKDGSYMWILDRGAALWAEDGTPVRMAGSETDITDRKLAEELLHKSVTRFDLAVQGSQDGLWYAERVSDNLFAPHNPIYYSPRMKEIMGVKNEAMPDVLGTWLSLVHPDDLPNVLAALTQHLEQRRPYDVEYRILQQGTGAVRWIGAKGQAVWDSSGQPIRMAGSFSDITKRKRAEEALRTSQEKLQQALRASHTGLWDWNTDTSETSFSTEWKHQLGHEQTELTDAFQSWESLLHPEDHDRAIAYVQAYLANPEGDYQQEFRLRHKDGSYRWIEARATFVTETDGRRVRLLGSHTDITERKQAQEKRYQSEAQLQAILDNSPSLIFLKDRDGRYIKVNREFETVFQLTSEEIIGRTDRDLFSPEQAALFQMNDQKVLESGRPLLVEEVSSHGDHSHVAIVHKFPLRDEKETLYAIGGIATDITERKKIEDALKLSEERLTEAQRVAHIGSWELDIIANHLWWSDEVFRIFEIDSMRFGASYQAFLEIVHPEDRQLVDRSYTESVTSRTSYNIEHRLLLPDGRVKHVHERCETFYDIAGTPLRSLGTVQDITERKKAELALRESEARTRSILETALDAVVSINDCGLIIGWNPQAEVLFGYSLQEVLGLPLDETIIPTRYRHAHAHGMNRMLQSDDGSAIKRRFEFFALHRSGQEFPVEFAIAASQVGGQPMFTAFIRDITERKQAEEALRESEERYRTLVELSPSGVFVLSEGRTVYINSTAVAILGATEPNDILARSPFEFIHPDYHEDVTKNLRRVLAGEATVHRAERVYLKMNGTPIQVQVEAVRITWNGKPAIQGFFSDITERKQAEHRLRLTQFTIDHAVDAIYWIDLQANIVDVNEAACEMLGYSKEDLCTMTVHDVNPDFQADRWPGFWAETQQRGTMVFETSHRTRDGRRLPVEIQVNYLSYKGQEFHCAFVRDITERKEAQEELRRSKARLSYILESNPTVVYTRQVGNGRPFTFITPNVHELLGYTSVDILTDPDRLDQAIHPDDDRDMITTGMPQLLRDGAQTFAYRLRHRDGRYCWIENRARLTDDGQGTLQIVGTMLEITQRKQAEEALATSERQLRTMLDSLPIGVWFTDRTGKTLLANPAAKQIWSNIKQVGLHSRENPSGWWETIEPANEPHRWALSQALTAGEASFNETLDLEDIDGRRKTIRNTTVPVKDESGTTIGAVILNEDLTDLRRIQETLKLTQFSVDHAVEAFFWIGPDAKILHVNEAACRMLEYTSDELTNMTVHDIDPNIPLETWAAHWEELKQKGALTFESKHWSRTGRVLDTEVTVNYLQYEGSEYNCAIIRDIGERKQAEEALRQSEERFRLLVEGAPLGITLLDEHFCYVKVNQAFCNLVGYREEDILGQTSALFIHSDDRASNLAVAAEANRGERASYRLEKRYIRKNQQPIWVTVNATSLPLRGNTDHHMVAIIEDITERKQLAEREASRVRQLKKLSELSMTLSGDPAVVFDQVVRIIGELFNVQVVCLSEIVGEELHFKSVYSDGRVLRNAGHCPLAITPCATVAQTKDMRIFDRVMERFPQATFLKDHEACSYCGFPALDSHGTVVAVTCLLDNKLHEFAEEEQELLRIIGQRIAVEIERSRHIREKQQAEDALRQNHALLSAIMEATMDIVFVKDLEGRYLHMNPAGARAVGLSVEEVVGKDDDAIWPADLAACCKEADRLILSTGSGQTLEESTLADGKRITYLTTKAPYRDAAGNMIGVIGVAHDISQIKQSEEDLRRSHAFIRQIIDTDPNFIFAKDREGRFTLVNKAVADAYGTTVDRLIGKTDADFDSNAQELAFFRKTDLEVLDSLHEHFVPEEMITDAAGRTRWLQTVKRPIIDESGRATMVLGASTDITERKRMEETLRQRERDLRTALDERERISQDLHDGILQSLYAVGLGLEACKPLMTQRHYKKAAASMDRAIGHLNHVMSEVRNFIAGLESQILQGSTFPMALRTMVQTLTADHPIPCTLKIDESLGDTFSTEQALHLLNVVREALSNSLRHAEATKTTVSLKSLSRSIRLTIADNGRGFNPASMHGAGHGLANMEARARKVGGRFAIRSVPQQGTRITIDVPKETCHAESESEHGSTAARR